MIFQCLDPLFIRLRSEGKVDPVSPHPWRPQHGIPARGTNRLGQHNGFVDGRTIWWVDRDYWIKYFFPGSAWGGIGWLVGWCGDYNIYAVLRCGCAGEGLFGEWEIGGGKRKRKMWGGGGGFFLLLFFFFFVEGVNLIYFGLGWNLFGARGLFIWDLFGRSLDLLVIGCYEWRIVFLGGIFGIWFCWSYLMLGFVYFVCLMVQWLD